MGGNRPGKQERRARQKKLAAAAWSVVKDFDSPPTAEPRETFLGVGFHEGPDWGAPFRPLGPHGFVGYPRESHRGPPVTGLEESGIVSPYPRFHLFPEKRSPNPTAPLLCELPDYPLRVVVRLREERNFVIGHFLDSIPGTLLDSESPGSHDSLSEWGAGRANPSPSPHALEPPPPSSVPRTWSYDETGRSRPDDPAEGPWAPPSIKCVW